MERVLEIVKNTEFLREIARSLDEQGKNKEKLDKLRSLTTDEILSQMEEGDRVNRRLNAGIVAITLIALGLIPLLF